MYLKSHGKKIIIGAGALVITFALGYWAGSKFSSKDSGLSPLPSKNDMGYSFNNMSSEITPAKQTTTSQDAMAASLNDLVVGLENKVLANPENVDQKILLGQTYHEIGSRDKSLKLLRELNQSHPTNAQVKIALATVLMKGEIRKELKESIQIFDDVIRLKPDAAKMARVHQEEARVKLGNIGK